MDLNKFNDEVRRKLIQAEQEQRLQAAAMINAVRDPDYAAAPTLLDRLRDVEKRLETMERIVGVTPLNK